MGWSKKNGVWNLHKEPTCLCAFDADPGNYIRNGSGVSQWNDLTGHGHHALQPIAVNQPTWIEKDLDFGGHGSIQFGSKWLQTGAWSITQPLSVYAVCKFGPDAVQVLMHGLASGQIVMYCNSATISAGNTVTASVDVRSAVNVIGFALNGASSALYISALTGVAGNGGTPTSTGLTVGANYSGNQPYTGKLAYLSLYTGGISSRIISHLGSKYGKAIAA